MNRINIEMPITLSDKMKQLAKKRRVALGVVYEEAVQKYLNKQKASK